MDTAPARPDASTLHEAVQRDWNRLYERADQAFVSVFDMEGSDRLITRMRSLVENPDLQAGMRQSLAGVLENHQQHVAARKHVEDWLSAGAEHMRRHEILEGEAVGMDLGITGAGSYPEWREETDRLIEVGEAILSDAKTYGAHLNNPAIGHAPVEQELSRLQRAIRDDDNYAAERKTLVQRNERVDRDDDAAKPDGMDTAPAPPDVRTLSGALERDWNRLDERADQAGVSTFDMEGSEALIARMRSLMKNPDLPAPAARGTRRHAGKIPTACRGAEAGRGYGSLPHARRKRRRHGRCETASNGKGQGAILGPVRATVRACPGAASLAAGLRGLGPGVERTP